MKTLRVNDYDMAYLDIGSGAPLVCVHGSLNDFRAWAPVLKPFSAGRRLIAPSLRHYFPEHWDGQGGKFTMAQHVDDMIAFISRDETLHAGEIIGSGTVDDGCGLERFEFLQDGDVVELEVEGIGVLRNRVEKG